MNFIVEFLPDKNTTFNGLNKLIFEYLNFRPFLKELLDKTDSIHKYIEYYGVNVDFSYGQIHISRNFDLKWEIYDGITQDRQHLFDITDDREKELGIKDNFKNFGYHTGLNRCYMYY